jgi:hypothetical protein
MHLLSFIVSQLAHDPGKIILLFLRSMAQYLLARSRAREARLRTSQTTARGGMRDDEQGNPVWSRLGCSKIVHLKTPTLFVDASSHSQTQDEQFGLSTDAGVLIPDM